MEASTSKAGGRKKLWYCVTSSFDDRGRTAAAITAVREAEAKPASGFTSTSTKDVYTDWFDEIKKAEAFVEEARNA